MKLTNKLTLTNEDCMELMKRTPDKYYSLAICDPPYGINGAKIGKYFSKNKKSYNKKDWDNSIPEKEYFDELFRVSKNQIIWGGNYFLEYLHSTKCIIIWDKINGENDMPDCEIAWTSFNSKIRKYSLHHFSQNYDKERFHPTQKPVALYKWLLDKYAKPNDKILDTHLGSMSIAIACHDYGFELDGCELDPEYYAKGIERVQDHVKQLKLF
jgi:site-specific DNA-methyltransferase (adenine-specific)